jgi:hypothetical protein
MSPSFEWPNNKGCIAAERSGASNYSIGRTSPAYFGEEMISPVWHLCLPGFVCRSNDGIL